MAQLPAATTRLGVGSGQAEEKGDGARLPLLDAAARMKDLSISARVSGKISLLLIAGALFGTLAVAGLWRALPGAVGLRKWPSELMRESEVVALQEVPLTREKFVSCILDVSQAALQLSQTGIFILFATRDCANQTMRIQRVACIATLDTVVSGVFYATSSAAAAASGCPLAMETLEVKCAAALTGMLGVLTQMCEVAAAVVEICSLGNPEFFRRTRYGWLPIGEAMATSAVFNGGRRLRWSLVSDLEKAASFDDQEHDEQANPNWWWKYRKYLNYNESSADPANDGEEEEEEEVSEEMLRAMALEDRPVRGGLTAQCVNDLNFALSAAARLGLTIYALSQECPKLNDKNERKTCALDIFNVIAAVAELVEQTAAAAVDCPILGDPKAACVAVSALFAGLLAQWGPVVNGVMDDCQPNLTGSPTLPPGWGHLK